MRPSFQGSKTVSVVTAVVVGIEILSAPINQAQSSNPAPPKIRDVPLISVVVSDYDLAYGFTVSVSLDLGSSGRCVWTPYGVYCIARYALVTYCTNLENTHQVSGTTYGLAFNFPITFNSYVGDGYYVVDISPINYQLSCGFTLIH